MFSRILIANRGEIALRIIKTCREIGIETVLVYSDADRDSLPVRLADMSICIGPGISNESYLDIKRIITAAEISDVEAIHPGYGFLSENIHFADICRSCEIEFIGPSAEVMKNFGDKSCARAIAQKAGVPVIPGSEGLIGSVEDAIKVAKKIGYPVMLKAAGGGGGRGMRQAHNEVSLANAFYAARAEAESAFGNSDIYIEKLIENPKHIEIQILADNYDNVVHLGERDCTVQRRHQKLIEESPSPAIDEKKRREISEAAVALAREVGYTNAGTFEFLLDKNNDFYFMEVNTRLQVEHPVTEMITGIDIVGKQLAVSSREPLGVKQEEIQFSGCAIECRINAEDTLNDFRPCPGTVELYSAPSDKEIRTDSHLYTGYTIPAYYDSLLSKLIVWGKNRGEAISRAIKSLKNYEIQGVHTTIPFTINILEHMDFQRGKIDTSFVEKRLLNEEK